MLSSETSEMGGSCFNRIPYGSLLALLICWVGVGLFCSMTYFAVNHSINMAHSIFGIDLPWLDKVQLSFIILGVVMGISAIILFILGVLATGETRRTVYKGWTGRLGGRISSGIFLGLTYVLHVFWLLILTCATCMGFSFYIFQRLCASPPECMDFSMFTHLLNGTQYASGGHAAANGGMVCGQQQRKFCTIANDALPEYIVGWIGCFLVLLSLVHFISCLSANYAHIKDEIKYIELNEIHAEYKLDERM